MTPRQQLDGRIQIRSVVRRIVVAVFITTFVVRNPASTFQTTLLRAESSRDSPARVMTASPSMTTATFWQQESTWMNSVDEHAALEITDHIVPIQRQEIERMRSGLCEMLERVACMRSRHMCWDGIATGTV